MIVHLKIQNYALIEHLEISPNRNLNVITGETGAGKSIMLGAVGLLLGNRADTKVLSNLDAKCIIEGEFDITQYQLEDAFHEENIDYESISIFRREISPSGKSRAFINDTPVTLETMKKIGQFLMNVHSQHQTLELGNKDFQLQLIDLFANNTELLTLYSEKFKKFGEAEKEYQHLIEEQKKSHEQKEYNNFLLKELVDANYELNEQEHLEEELKLLEHAEEIKLALFKVNQLLDESDFSTIRGLEESKIHLGNVSRLTDKFVGLAERLSSSIIEIKDLTQTIYSEAEDIEVNPERLIFVQDRLSLLFKLQQKHAVDSIENLNAIRDLLEVKSARSINIENEISSASERKEQLLRDVLSLSQKLSTNRMRVFEQLHNELIQLLKDLGMENSSIEFERNEIPISKFGVDEIVLKFSANKGVSPQPIKQVASGGELSRLMFSIKYVLASKIALPTIVFDEIDTGISGEIALKMGRMMLEMAKNHQVITITHLPQIASFGQRHFYVFKDNNAHTTKSIMKELSNKERELEIAKMIGGDHPSEAAVSSAKELLKNSPLTLN